MITTRAPDGANNAKEVIDNTFDIPMIFHLTFEISNAGSPDENTVHNRSRAKEASVAGMIIIS